VASFRAKVFISCGQRKEKEEIQIAQAIKKVLEDDLGFDTYIAVQEQTLRGLKENIFSQLTSSEYFLFVDFPREQFANSEEHRGSLFSHQEMAIASYLDLPVIAFQQKGVKQLDGMLSILQVNAIPFEDATKLSDMVREQVQKAGWLSNWKNALSIERDPRQFDDALTSGGKGLLARFFQLNVKNLNPYKLALNCTAYIESIRTFPSSHQLPLRTVELKWGGYILPNATIMRSSFRQLDACFVFHNEPYIIHFSSFSDSSYFMPPIKGPGQFELDFTVVSDNFPAAHATVLATVGNSIEDAKIEIQG
jgi:hypothetical protein